MLPSDFNPERQARQRFLKRQADLREQGTFITEVAKIAGTPAASFRVQIRLERQDIEEPSTVRGARGASLYDFIMDEFKVQDIRVDRDTRFSIIAIVSRVNSAAAAKKVVQQIIDKAQSEYGRFVATEEVGATINEARKMKFVSQESLFEFEVPLDQEGDSLPGGFGDRLARAASNRGWKHSFFSKRFFVTIPAKSRGEAQKILNMEVVAAS